MNSKSSNSKSIPNSPKIKQHSRGSSISRISRNSSNPKYRMKNSAFNLRSRNLHSRHNSTVKDDLTTHIKLNAPKISNFLPISSQQKLQPSHPDFRASSQKHISLKDIKTNLATNETKKIKAARYSRDRVRSRSDQLLKKQLYRIPSSYNRQTNKMKITRKKLLKNYPSAFEGNEFLKNLTSNNNLGLNNTKRNLKKKTSLILNRKSFGNETISISEQSNVELKKLSHCKSLTNRYGDLGTLYEMKIDGQKKIVKIRDKNQRGRRLNGFFSSSTLFKNKRASSLISKLTNRFQNHCHEKEGKSSFKKNTPFKVNTRKRVRQRKSLKDSENSQFSVYQFNDEDDGYWFTEYENDFLKVLGVIQDIIFNINYYCGVVRGKKAAMQRLLDNIFSRMGLGPYQVQKTMSYEDKTLKSTAIIKPNHIDSCSLVTLVYKGETSKSHILEILVRSLSKGGKSYPDNFMERLHFNFGVKLICSPSILQELLMFRGCLSEFMLQVKSVGIQKNREIADIVMKNIGQWTHREKLRIDELRTAIYAKHKNTYGVLSDIPNYTAHQKSLIGRMEVFENKGEHQINISKDKRTLNVSNRILVDHLKQSISEKEKSSLKMVVIKNEQFREPGLLGVVDYK